MGDATSEDGFSLIEILVVVIILAILAAVVTFAVMGLSGEGTATANEADERTLQKAEEAYYAQQSSPPRVYADETQLQAGQFIAGQSALHDICLNGAHTKYRVVPADTDCATVTFP
jgi:prepilin-type N-terminal cleavage/methylation domain-containing protein